MSSYCGEPPLPEDWLLRWNLDPVLLLGLAICAAIALRSERPRLALGGVGVLAIAFVSPLCALSVALFSARAVHHIALVAIAAPLIALAFPARRSGQLAAALLVATITLWLWHVPTFYDRALANTPLYWLMQFSLMASAIWMWRNVFAAPPVPALLAAIFAMAQMGLLGALLTFAPDALYAAHAGTTLAWGIGPLADQQLAGLVMWVPGILPYAILTAMLARRFLDAGGERSMIVAVKLLHIAALSVWCAGLVGLPLLLAKHEAGDEQEDYARLRLLTHHAYIRVVTPAAVVAIALGTALIFMRGVFVPWMFAKLVLVGALVLLHAWIGHVTVNIGESRGGYAPQRAWPFLAATLAAMLIILVLVLGKPVLDGELLPSWLVAPQDQPLPVDEVPR